MINKKFFITTAVIIAVFLIGAGIFSYFYSRTPKEVTKEIVTLSQKDGDIDKYLTQNFIDQVKNGGASDKDFLDTNVSGYDVKESIEAISQKTVTDSKATVEVTVRTVTTNVETKFRVTTIDKYEATLVKIKGGWKMDSYVLIDSKTDK